MRNSFKLSLPYTSNIKDAMKIAKIGSTFLKILQRSVEAHPRVRLKNLMRKKVFGMKEVMKEVDKRIGRKNVLKTSGNITNDLYLLLINTSI